MSRFERLSPERDIQSFTSGNNDLDSWLRDAATTADRAGTARVYLWISDDDRIIGYYAVIPHGIRREDVPSSVGRGAPDVIPGFLLARLALSGQLHGQHLGGDLLAEALTTILNAIRIAGGRVIVVDAIDERARGLLRTLRLPIPASERLSPGHEGEHGGDLSVDRLAVTASARLAGRGNGRGPLRRSPRPCGAG